MDHRLHEWLAEHVRESGFDGTRGVEPFAQDLGMRSLQGFQIVFQLSGFRGFDDDSTYAGPGGYPIECDLGHADWGIVRKRYGRWIPSVNPSVGLRANEIAEQVSEEVSNGEKTVTEKIP